MTAPAAPVITGHARGIAVSVQFPAVPGAATYNVYEGASTAPTTRLLTGQTATYITFQPLNEPSHVRVTAVNAGAEESAYSNELVFNQGSGAGNRLTTHDPFGAYDRRDN